MREFIREWSYEILTTVAFINAIVAPSPVALGIFALQLGVLFQSKHYSHIRMQKEQEKIEIQEASRADKAQKEHDQNIKATSELEQMRSRLTKVELLLNLKPLSIPKNQ